MTTKGDESVRKQWQTMALVLAVGTVAALAAAVSASAQAAMKQSGAAKRHGVKTATCTTSIGYVGPLTGPVATVGQEQHHFAQVALADWNARYHTHFKMVEGDDQLDPAQTGPVVQGFVSNPSIVGVVGPAGTGETQVAGPIAAKASLALVSMSAGGAQLSGAFKTFFRVIPSSRVQAPTDAKFIATHLKPKYVTVIDTQSDFSVPLANAVQKDLEARGIHVQRQSVSLKQTDYSANIGKINPQTTVIFLPWEVATSVQLFGQQLRAQSKHATIFATNGAFSPKQFTINGSYVSAFSPDIRAYKADRTLVKEYESKYNNTFGIYGPPTYVATQVVLNAMYNICKTGAKPTRRGVLAQIRKTDLRKTILGHSIRFNHAGDVIGAKYYVFQIRHGKYVLVQ